MIENISILVKRCQTRTHSNTKRKKPQPNPKTNKTQPMNQIPQTHRKPPQTTNKTPRRSGPCRRVSALGQRSHGSSASVSKRGHLWNCMRTGPAQGITCPKHCSQPLMICIPETFWVRDCTSKSYLNHLYVRYPALITLLCKSRQ